jgi:putative membrane protein insertion efficiency factor
MWLKRFFIIPIEAYQYLSRMWPGNCRYYPTCSEYAKWQFEFNRADIAIIATTQRILKCNQFFAGGTDYPRVRWRPPNISAMANPVYRGTHIFSPLPKPQVTDRKFSIQYWIVPDKQEGIYLVLKAFRD